MSQKERSEFAAQDKGERMKRDTTETELFVGYTRIQEEEAPGCVVVLQMLMRMTLMVMV
jgi:hypothetical protein